MALFEASTVEVQANLFPSDTSAILGQTDPLVVGQSVSKSANVRPCDSHHEKALHQFIKEVLIQYLLPFLAVIIEPLLHVPALAENAINKPRTDKNIIVFMLRSPLI